MTKPPPSANLFIERKVETSIVRFGSIVRILLHAEMV